MGFFIVLAQDRPQVLDDRLANRAAHLDYWADKPVKVAGAILEDGDPAGSAFIIEAENEPAVRALVAQDPFMRRSVFSGEVTIFGIRPAIGEWLTG